MSKNHHGGPAPIPPGNRPNGGSQPGAEAGGPAGDQEAIPHEGDGKMQEQDPKRRLGNYEQKGGHSIQQPSRLNDGAHGGHGGRSKE